MTDLQPSTVAERPGEMSASVHVRFGASVSLQATARVTPAGLIAVGMLVSAIMLSVVPLVRAAREPRR